MSKPKEIRVHGKNVVPKSANVGDVYVEKAAYTALLKENARLRAREINGSLRGYDGMAEKVQGLVEAIENEKKHSIKILWNPEHEQWEVNQIFDGKVVAGGTLNCTMEFVSCTQALREALAKFRGEK